MFLGLYIILSIILVIAVPMSRDKEWAKWLTVGCFGGIVTMWTLMFSYTIPDRPKFTELVDNNIANVLKFQTTEGGYYYKFWFNGHYRVTRDVECDN